MAFAEGADLALTPVIIGYNSYFVQFYKGQGRASRKSAEKVINLLRDAKDFCITGTGIQIKDQDHGCTKEKNEQIQA